MTENAADPFGAPATADPFGAPAAAPADPFGGGAPPAEQPPAAQPPAAAPVEPEPQPEPPIVNREGEEVPATDPETPVEPEPAPTEPAVTPGEPVVTPVEPAEVTQPAAHEPGGSDPEDAYWDHAQGEVKEGEETPSEHSADEEQPDPPSPVEGDDSADETPATGEGAATRQPDAAGKKSPVRYYKVLYQTGKAQWTEADLPSPDKNHNIVVRTDKKTGSTARWLAARNNEHALRLAFAVLGSPNDGATILPVPEGGWKPKRVAPELQPEKVRLAIS